MYSVPTLAQAGETIDSVQREVFPGGKGLNQSIAASKAGCDVVHYGAIGPDGVELVDYLQTHQVDTDPVLRLESASGHAFIQVDAAGRNAIVIHGGSNRLLPDRYWLAAIESLEEGDWLLLQNETNAVTEMIEHAHARGVKLAINLAPADSSVRALPIDKVDLLIVNEAEACALADLSTPESAFAALCDQLKHTDIVMTLGKDGLRVCSGEERMLNSLDAFVVSAVDETAAGDAFVGYLMADLVAGVTLTEAVKRASAAGALAVTKAGAAPSIPDADEVAQLVETSRLTN